jgi:hypothetical protein
LAGKEIKMSEDMEFVAKVFAISLTIGTILDWIIYAAFAGAIIKYRKQIFNKIKGWVGR